MLCYLVLRPYSVSCWLAEVSSSKESDTHTMNQADDNLLVRSLRLSLNLHNSPFNFNGLNRIVRGNVL